MDFEILPSFTRIEVIARGRKMKGSATVRFSTSLAPRKEEIRWYEPHGIGKREFKIKRH